MRLDLEVHEWNNPLMDIASDYYMNGAFTEHGGHFSVILTREELMLVVSYMMLGMHKVKAIKEGRQ